jgi:hypothetical protein
MTKWLIPVALGLALAVSIAMLWKEAHAQVTIGSPIATVTTMTGVSVPIIPLNPSRKSITICSGGTTVNIAPAPIAPSAVGATGTGLTLAAGACFNPPFVTNATVGAGAAWNGNGTGGTVIVLEWL